MAQNDGLMTVAEVAAALAITDETVHRWCREDRLEYVRLGPRTKRFRRAYIEDLVSGGGSAAARAGDGSPKVEEYGASTDLARVDASP